MEWWEDRVANGLAKAGGGFQTREQIESALAQDVAIYVDPRRATMADLWPAIWALAATLSRQFTGQIFIAAGLRAPLPAPARLPSRCCFIDHPPPCSLVVGLGTIPGQVTNTVWWGDVKNDRIAVRQSLTSHDVATPWGAFALAGYLSYALLAEAAGLAPYKERFCQPEISLGLPDLRLNASTQHLAILGLGHLGNAYLALLFFIAQRYGGFPTLLLLDRSEGGGRLEPPNWKTHVLLDEVFNWQGLLKTEMLAGRMKTCGAVVTVDATILNWGWKKPQDHPPCALLGFDSLDTRRMAVEAGYKWLVDGGIGTHFNRPRITWHSLPGDRLVGKSLFDVPLIDAAHQIPNDSPLARSLNDPSDPCGSMRLFGGISAAAPSMGIVAAAYAWVQVLKLWSGEALPIKGSAYLWSPGIPPCVESLSHSRSGWPNHNAPVW
jgi:hypothetical protein